MAARERREQEADALTSARPGDTIGSVMQRAREEGPLTKHGEIGRGRNRVDKVNSTATNKGGNRQSYLARRLLRDAPETFEALERGEFKSVRAAAIEAGIVKPETPAVAGKWDQADALLLLESGWTQERIADKVKKSKSWVDYYLRFGRFLHSHHGGNLPSDAPGASIPSNLTERAFRNAWSKTLKTVDGKKRLTT